MEICPFYVVNLEENILKKLQKDAFHQVKMVKTKQGIPTHKLSVLEWSQSLFPYNSAAAYLPDQHTNHINHHLFVLKHRQGHSHIAHTHTNMHTHAALCALVPWEVHVVYLMGTRGRTAKLTTVH